eukprot:c24941_g1_i2 orf=110-934(+)
MAGGSTAMKLEGKVAIITGGASGIGEATVRLFVSNGAFVVIADIDDDKGAQLANEVGRRAAAYKHCDVSLEHEVEELVAFTIEKWGKLDIMYNNAGIVPGNFTTTLEDVRALNMHEFDCVMSVNVRGMALGIKYASRAMVEAKTKGSIICTASIASIMAGLTPVSYTVSKHAIIGLMRAASSDLGKYGIRVNCVSPYLVATPLGLKAFGDQSSSLMKIQALSDSKSNLAGHSLTSSDIARTALYLACDDAAFVSGLNLVVDGGFTATNHSFNDI